MFISLQGGAQTFTGHNNTIVKFIFRCVVIQIEEEEIPKKHPIIQHCILFPKRKLNFTAFLINLICQKLQMNGWKNGSHTIIMTQFEALLKPNTKILKSIVESVNLTNKYWIFPLYVLSNPICTEMIRTRLLHLIFALIHSTAHWPALRAVQLLTLETNRAGHSILSHMSWISLFNFHFPLTKIIIFTANNSIFSHFFTLN